MWLSLIGGLIVLAALVLALGGAFGYFPDKWQWVSIILGGVGTAMSTPNVLEMIIGRPKLLVEFDRIVDKEERALAIFLKNPPIHNKVWNKLGITRDSIQ